MKAAFHTLGCKTNSYETQAIREQFEASGFEIVSFTEPADVYIINTCSVTAVAARKSRQMLSRCRKLAPDAVVAACGCYAQEASETLAQSGVDLVIGNNEKSKIIDLVKTCLSGKEQKTASAGAFGNILVDDLKRCTEYEEQQITNAGEHVRAYVKIQDGCNRFCSYCIIPYLRGRSRSRDPEEILKEVKGLSKAGIREIVLTGIDISDYHNTKNRDDVSDNFGTGNKENDPGKDLAELILSIEAMEQIDRIRLGSLEAGIITESFLERIRESRKICPHFHLSLQSGCDATLKRMNRDYTSEEFLHSLSMIRSCFANPAITTDVIAGFAGETEEEFEETLRFVEKAGFSQLHVFPYSRRKGTRADLMPGQLTNAQKAERTARLIRLGDTLQRRYMSSFLKQPVQILTEEVIRIDGEDWLIGFTPEYVKAAVRGGSENINKIVTIVPEQIEEVKQELLLI